MAQGTGHIVNFNEPPKGDQPVEIKTARPQQGDLQRLSSVTGVQQGVEVIQHEAVILETDKLRSVVRKPGDPEIRIRVGDPKLDVTRIEDDDD